MRKAWWLQEPRTPKNYNRWEVQLEFECKDMILAVLKNYNKVGTNPRFVVGFKNKNKESFNFTSMEHRTQSGAMKKLNSMRKALEFVTIR